VIPLLSLLALASGGLLLFLFNPEQSGFYPFCVFHRITGLQCPGCGSLRAMHNLLHGNIPAAFHYNALLVLSLPLLFAQAVRIGNARFSHQPARAHINAAWLWSGMLVLIVFGVLRNLPFPVFAWLAH
jgi:hypothetical protein